MSKIRTLNEIEHLESSGYGRPCPRHGLHLLYWFCNDYVSVDNNGDLVASEHPKGKKYGFHWFGNHSEDDGQLLPQQNTSYFEVGNLFAPGAGDLPEYVRLNNRRDSNLSNMDRIIISLRSRLIVDKVYVTQHIDRSKFDRQNTFCISKGLVMILRNLDLEDGLLWQVGYLSQTASLHVPPAQLPRPGGSGWARDDDDNSWRSEESRGGWRPVDDVVIRMPHENLRPKKCCNCVIL